MGAVDRCVQEHVDQGIDETVDSPDHATVWDRYSYRQSPTSGDGDFLGQSLGFRRRWLDRAPQLVPIRRTD